MKMQKNKFGIMFLSLMFGLVLFMPQIVWAQQCDCTCIGGTHVGPVDNENDCSDACEGRYSCSPISDVGSGNLDSAAKTGELKNPLGNTTSIPDIIGEVIKIILSLIGIVSLLMFIYAGLVWLTAQGKPEAIKKGRDTMVWAVIGLVLVFSSYIILNQVFELLTF